MVTQPSTNKIAWRWDTDLFGTAAPNQNPQGLGTFVYNPRYPGQYCDSETGLSQNYFREYDPAVGRYVESDPIGMRGGRNTYAYVDGNPVSRRDPFGLKIVVGGDPADYNTATAYLNQDAGMAQIIKGLDSASTVYKSFTSMMEMIATIRLPTQCIGIREVLFCVRRGANRHLPWASAMSWRTRMRVFGIASLAGSRGRTTTFLRNGG
jgi:RHS repeat-associated protein